MGGDRARALSGDRAGTVVSISRYPVKSMRAEPLEAAALHWPWLLGDRQYAFVKASNTSDFPWLTARDVPSLVRFGARYDRPDDPVHSAVTVTDPAGAEFNIRDPALAAQLSDAAGTEVWLIRLGRGCFDAMPVSILTSTTAAEVERAHGSAVAVERFRANLVIRTDDSQAAERDWLGRSLAVGSEGACLDVGWAIPRCALVGIDPATGARDPLMVRTVAQRFGNRVGAYCSVRRPGTVRIGDTVALTDMADERGGASGTWEPSSGSNALP